MKRFITHDGTILTPAECRWIAEFRRWTPAQQAEAIELLREWTKEKGVRHERRSYVETGRLGRGFFPAPALLLQRTPRRWRQSGGDPLRHAVA